MPGRSQILRSWVKWRIFTRRDSTSFHGNGRCPTVEFCHLIIPVLWHPLLTRDTKGLVIFDGLLIWKRNRFVLNFLERMRKPTWKYRQTAIFWRIISEDSAIIGPFWVVSTNVRSGFYYSLFSSFISINNVHIPWHPLRTEDGHSSNQVRNRLK